jgi:hypothetical protein
MATTSMRRVGVASMLLYAGLILAFLFAGRALPLTSVVGATTSPTSAQWMCTGTKFFNSAGIGTQFTTGSVRDGGTFWVENNNYMEVRDNPSASPQGYIVGEFEQPARLGDTATITFNRTIQIVSVYWWDNDPDIGAGETGWSFNGVAGPLTGQMASAITAVNYVTNTVTISAGNDSGGVDFCYVEIPTGGGEGCTPGYWKNHTSSWAPSGYTTSQLVSSVFSGANAGQASATLLQALGFSGGSGVDGAERVLLRAAVAALLNAAHPGVDYDWAAADIISQVSAALAGNDRDAILALATTLDNENNSGCTLN